MKTTTSIMLGLRMDRQTNLIILTLTLFVGLCRQVVEGSKVWTLTVDGHDAVGCYQDVQSNRLLPRLLLEFLEETPLRCINACKGRPEKYAIAGIEGGTNCFCGYTSDIPSEQERIPPPRCSLPCSGDSSFLCGGDLAIMIYQINATRYAKTVISPAYGEHKIYEDVLKNYDKTQRPVRNLSTDSITVSLTPKLISLSSPQGVQSDTIRATMTVDLLWADQKLKWDPTKQGSITSLRFPPKVLWIPPIFVMSPVGKRSIFTGMEHQMMGASHMGEISMDMQLNIDTICYSEDLSKFPFDTLKCEFNFRSQQYDVEDLKLGLNRASDTLGSFRENPNFEVTSFEIFAPNNRHEAEILVHEIRADLRLKRKSAYGYYTSMLLLPVFFITTIVSIGLFSPSNIRAMRTEKVTISLFGLMIMMLAFLLVESPGTAGSITLIGKFVMIEMMMIMVGTLIATLLTVLHHNGVMKGNMVPEWMIKFTCYPRHGKIASLHGEESEDIMMAEMWKKVAANISLESDRKESSNNWLLRQCLDNLVGVRNRLEDQRGRMEERGRWGLVTARLDFICLVVFNLINIFLTLILFFPVR